MRIHRFIVGCWDILNILLSSILHPWVQVRVEGLSSSPGLSVTSLARGQYLQVVGQLVSARAVRCQKLTDLSRNNHCQLMWDLEVAELHGLLAGSIEFAEI